MRLGVIKDLYLAGGPKQNKSLFRFDWSEKPCIATQFFVGKSGTREIAQLLDKSCIFTRFSGLNVIVNSVIHTKICVKNLSFVQKLRLFA